jgi:hypothetical protein
VKTDRLSGIGHGYVELPLGASDNVTGRRFSGKLHRSCESVEALSRASWSDFEAYPAVCLSPGGCLHWRECIRLQRRRGIIQTARAFARSILRSRWRS